MTSGQNPIVRRRRLGTELRVLREAAGKTSEEVAEHLGCAQSKISRIENGRSPVSPGDVRLMLEFYGVEGDRVDQLVGLARESKQKGWWQPYASALPKSLQTYIGLEAEAKLLRTYESQLIPGLLQTEVYARAVIRTDVGVAEEDVERRIAVRISRQELLTHKRPLRLWTLIDEAALRRPVAGAEVMGAQLRHLAEVAKLRHVTVQVLPYSAGEHPCMSGAFVLMSFPDPHDSDVVYLEDLNGGQLIGKPDEAQRFGLIFDRLVAKAYDAPTSLQMIESVYR
jgi:transcriptional regulator with XRE-family HTH domain